MATVRAHPVTPFKWPKFREQKASNRKEEAAFATDASSVARRRRGVKVHTVASRNATREVMAWPAGRGPGIPTGWRTLAGLSGQPSSTTCYTVPISPPSTTTISSRGFDSIQPKRPHMAPCSLTPCLPKASGYSSNAHADFFAYFKIIPGDSRDSGRELL